MYLFDNQEFKAESCIAVFTFVIQYSITNVKYVKRALTGKYLKFVTYSTQIIPITTFR